MRELLDRLTWLNEQGICHKLRKITRLPRCSVMIANSLAQAHIASSATDAVMYTDIKLLRKYLSECRDCIKIIVADLGLPGDKENERRWHIACSYRANLICPAGSIY